MTWGVPYKRESYNTHYHQMPRSVSPAVLYAIFEDSTDWGIASHGRNVTRIDIQWCQSNSPLLVLLGPARHRSILHLQNSQSKVTPPPKITHSPPSEGERIHIRVGTNGIIRRRDMHMLRNWRRRRLRGRGRRGNGRRVDWPVIVFEN